MISSCPHLLCNILLLCKVCNLSVMMTMVKFLCIFSVSPLPWTPAKSAVSAYHRTLFFKQNFVVCQGKVWHHTAHGPQSSIPNCGHWNGVRPIGPKIGSRGTWERGKWKNTNTSQPWAHHIPPYASTSWARHKHITALSNASTSWARHKHIPPFISKKNNTWRISDKFTTVCKSAGTDKKAAKSII